MQRAALLTILVLSLAIFGVGQTTTGSSTATPGPTATPTPATTQQATQPGAPTTAPNQPNTAPPATAPSQAGVPVGPGLVQQGGFVQQTVGGTTVLAPAGATPLVKTPIVTLDAPAADPVGASNATGNLTSGASNATLAQPNVSTGGIVVDQAEANTPAGFDPGPGAGSGVGTAVGVGGKGGEISLADAARRSRGTRGQANARVYTNEDIQRLNQAPGFRSGEQIEREDALASAAAQPGSAEAGGQGVTPVAPEAEGEPIAQQGAGQSAGSEATQGRVVTEARAATTPQTPEAQGSAQEAEREQLPASASPLPLAALLGLLFAGGGVAFALRRK